MNPFNARGYPSQQAKHPNNISTPNGATTLDRNEQDCHTEASEIEPLFSNVDDIKLYESNNNQTAQVLKIPIYSLCEICCLRNAFSQNSSFTGKNASRVIVFRTFVTV